MYIRRAKGPVSVRLPDGRVITRSDLPPQGTSRWVSSRKAIAAQAVEHGLISAEEALALYEISAEELAGWQHALNAHGRMALRTTAIQKYRHA